jgi:hypothetical protein
MRFPRAMVTHCGNACFFRNKIRKAAVGSAFFDCTARAVV